MTLSRPLPALITSLPSPASMRSRTVIVRTSDHGELGLAHGGMRQKMFNVYEEALRVPFVVSSPAHFAAPSPRSNNDLACTRQRTQELPIGPVRHARALAATFYIGGPEVDPLQDPHFNDVVERG